MKIQHEPALSYDMGTYLWAIDAQFNGPEHQRCELVSQIESNHETVRLGMQRIAAAYDAECQRH